MNTFDKSQSQICLGNIKSIVCCVFQKYLTWYECIKTPHCGHINVKKFYNIHSLIELTLFSEAFLSSFFFSELEKEMNDMIAILAHSHLEIVIQAMAKNYGVPKSIKYHTALIIEGDFKEELLKGMTW